MENYENRNAFSVSFWNYKRIMLKIEYPDLSEADLTYVPGNLGELVNGLGLKLKKSDNEIRELITQF